MNRNYAAKRYPKSFGIDDTVKDNKTKSVAKVNYFPCHTLTYSTPRAVFQLNSKTSRFLAFT